MRCLFLCFIWLSVSHAWSSEIHFADFKECKDNKNKPLPEVLQGQFSFKGETNEKHFIVGDQGFERTNFAVHDVSYYQDNGYCVLHKWKESRKKIVLKTILKRNKFFFPSIMRFHTTHVLTFDKREKRFFYREKELFAANILVAIPVVFPRKTKKREMVKNYF